MKSMGGVMHEQDLLRKGTSSDYNECFLDYMRLFAEAGETEKLFPRWCAACKKKFESLNHYIRSTAPRRHCMEDCRSIMGRPFTMIYRQCGCGNTLVVNVTEETVSFLDSFWEMLTSEARQQGKPLTEVVRVFVDQWELYVRNHEGPQREK
jgi:hypothetical protein